MEDFMIELKKVSKTYKSKKSANTIALKDISIKFPEKGMVFILGKSGSGKSTLLNVLGGLDKYDNGDLIINGKSTKNFSAKEFDAYRNTYIGFIFQDFNILEKYNVYDNVKLSLDLQDKKVSKQEIEATLNKVGIDNLGKRKTNELSGGQKQRVAIARALIKNPDVILADEPTGNLDSTTSTQIFELLKELSKNKLVIIVSHDSESAKKYADRIIELKDGEIIDDSEKEPEKLKNTQEFKLIYSKLPLKYSLKMGLGNIMHKKFSFLITIILITAALTCLGIMFSTTSYNMQDELIGKMVDNDEYEVKIISYDDVYSSEETIRSIMLTFSDTGIKRIDVDDDVLKDATQKTNLNWYKQINLIQNQEKAYLDYINDTTFSSLYYADTSTLLFVESDDNIVKENIIGKYPENSDEILISNYIADNIIQSGITIKEDNTEKVYKPTSYNQIISENKLIKISGIDKYVKISGIIEYDMSKYNTLKSVSYDEYFNSGALLMDPTDEIYVLYDELSLDKYSRIFVTNNFIENLKLKENNVVSTTSKIVYEGSIYIVGQIGYVSEPINAYNGTEIAKFDSLDSDSVIIDLGILNQITRNDFINKYEEYLNSTSVVEIDKEAFIKKYIKDKNIIGDTFKNNITANGTVQSIGNYNNYKIVGVILDDVENSTMYYNKDIVYSKITNNTECESIYTIVENEEQLKNLFANYPSDNSKNILTTRYSDEFLGTSVYTWLAKTAGKYGTTFFLIFAVVLIFNFIVSSINYRKKEIGILRAIGCKSKDVLKIFIIESLVLVIFVLVLSNFTVSNIVNSLNTSIEKEIGRETRFFIFGNIEFLKLALSTIVMVLIANVIPTKHITKMKPIDAILNK
jgi:ABC-type lipoprotein export system ATPase subunit/ABC-type antimicrobial peptide transport system permease subunit